MKCRHSDAGTQLVSRFVSYCTQLVDTVLGARRQKGNPTPSLSLQKFTRGCLRENGGFSMS